MGSNVSRKKIRETVHKAAEENRNNHKDVYVANVDLGRYKKGEKFSTRHQNRKIYFLERVEEASDPMDYIARPIVVDLKRTNAATFVETVTNSRLAEMVESGDVVQ